MNVCHFLGNICKQPETRQVGDSSVTSFTVACTERWKDKSGQKQEKTEFVNCQCWGKQGEIIAQYVSKGDRLQVTGSQETRKYQASDGSDRYSTSIKVKEFELQPSRKSNDQGDQQGQQEYEPPQGNGRDDSQEVPF